ncbi:MAG: trypsin-like peptidase domain-containing protein [Desulfobacterales bacterium]|nr:trypsin-like peptidase domain-containing protein [Desulfobacterales bacterium]
MIKKASILFLAIISIQIVIPYISLARELTTFFDQQWLKAVVSIEKYNDKNEIKPIGTGFLIRSSKGHILLVSAKHVVSEKSGKIKKALAYRINLQNGKGKILQDKQIVSAGGGSWFLSKSADIAVRFMYILFLESDIITIPQNLFLKYENVQPGTPALILGFPMGLRSEEYSTAIVRRSIVSLKEPTHYMIDGFAFPGNSGGPVVYMPAFQIGGITLGNYIKKQMLLGVVSSYIPYRDTAISVQTKRPRIIFEENSGLAIVVPAGELIKLINRDDVKAFDNNLK